MYLELDRKICLYPGTKNLGITVATAFHRLNRYLFSALIALNLVWKTRDVPALLLLAETFSIRNFCEVKRKNRLKD